MAKPLVELYMNDPMGKRWLNIMDAARRAAKELDAEIVIIKKTSAEYAALQDKPPCPSVAVNGTFIGRNESVTFDQIKAAIQGR